MKKFSQSNFISVIMTIIRMIFFLLFIALRNNSIRFHLELTVFCTVLAKLSVWPIQNSKTRRDSFLSFFHWNIFSVAEMMERCNANHIEHSCCITFLHILYYTLYKLFSTSCCVLVALRSIVRKLTKIIIVWLVHNDSKLGIHNSPRFI